DHPRCPRAQPQERLARSPARQAHRVHRALRVRQVVARLRHHLRRGPAAIRGIALGLRPPVPGPDGQARRRLHRGPVTGHLDRPEVSVPQPPLHRRHDHRGVRLPPAAVGPHRGSALPDLRPGGGPPDPSADRRPHPRAA
ncbi:MAG: Excinuclease ABC subunit A, partial [uncultured Acidimicrobiales bacterium]